MLTAKFAIIQLALLKMFLEDGLGGSAVVAERF